MGNSADRAWQLSQLVEGVSTAFNPSHGSLSYVQARRCVSKQIGRHDASLPRLPTARFSLAGSSLLPGPRARRARFPTCGVIRVAGIHFSRFSEGCFESPHYPSRKNGQVNNRFSKIFEIFFLTAFFEAFSRDVPSDKRLRGDIRQAALRTRASTDHQKTPRGSFPDLPGPTFPRLRLTF